MAVSVPELVERYPVFTYTVATAALFALVRVAIAETGMTDGRNLNLVAAVATVGVAFVVASAVGRFRDGRSTGLAGPGGDGTVRGVGDRLGGAAAGIAAFFDPRAVDGSMSALRDALRELPEAVFADALESDDAYLLVLDLPGVSAETADVEVERGKLVIEARREKDLPTEFRYVREDRALFLDAELPLPPDASDEGAEANMERGVLEVRLPKRGAGERRSIPISDA